MKKRFDPKYQRPTLSLITAGSLLCLQACGGGGGGGGGGLASVIDPGGGGTGGGQGIVGTGLTSSGTIDGAGSVFVNGVRFDIDEAEIAIDGKKAREDDLGPGMAVTVKGTVAGDGKSGKATRVDVSTSLEGPVTAIERNADNSSARLTILGQAVIVERTSTVFEGTRFGALRAGAALEVSGYRDPDKRLRATRVEVDDDPNEVKIDGTVGALNGLNFRIGAQRIDASAANLGDLPNSALSAGLRVSVEGRLVNGVIVADDIDPADDLSRGLQANGAITLLGSVSGLSGSSFSVEGLTVNSGNAQIKMGGLPLANGRIVEVRGAWDGRQVAASAVTGRRGRIEFEGSLASVDRASKSLALRVGNDTVSVTTDERTLFDDERDDIKFLKLSDLATGDSLKVEALSMDGKLLATRVDREDDDDDDEDTVLQAPVQSFVNGISVTLLGVTFNVTRAEFENVDDKDIDAAAFFANLKTGALLRVTDEAPADGFAEEVEFEFATALDGEREFEDDDEERVDPASLPQKVRDYLAANFPGRGIAFANRDDDELEVYLTDGTKVVFDLNGNFVETDDDDDDDDDRDDDKDDDSDDKDDDGNDDKDNDGNDDKDDDGNDGKDDDGNDDKDDDGNDGKDDDGNDDKDDDGNDGKDNDGNDDKDDDGNDGKDDDGNDDKDNDGNDDKDDDSDDNSGDDSSNDGSDDNSGDDSSNDDSDDNSGDDSSNDGSDDNSGDDSSNDGSDDNSGDDSSNDGSDDNSGDDSSNDGSDDNSGDDSSNDDSDDNSGDDSSNDGSDDNSGDDSSNDGSDDNSGDDSSSDGSDDNSGDDSSNDGSDDNSGDDSSSDSSDDNSGDDSSNDGSDDNSEDDGGDSGGDGGSDGSGGDDGDS